MSVNRELGKLFALPLYSGTPDNSWRENMFDFYVLLLKMFKINNQREIAEV